MQPVISEEKGWALEIVYFRELESTQKYLVDKIKEGILCAPICVLTENQTAGIGSKDNCWDGVEGNLFFSFALPFKSLPPDLPRQSICIYLLYIFKQCLHGLGSSVKLKWPNDLYINGKKVCGAMTNIVKGVVVCGIGLNSSFAPPKHAVLDISIDKNKLLADYFEVVQNATNWEAIFSKYEVEFSSNKQEFFGDFLTQGQSVELERDGSLIIDGTKVFGIR